MFHTLLEQDTRLWQPTVASPCQVFAQTVFAFGLPQPFWRAAFCFLLLPTCHSLSEPRTAHLGPAVWRILFLPHQSGFGCLSRSSPPSPFPSAARPSPHWPALPLHPPGVANEPRRNIGVLGLAQAVLLGAALGREALLLLRVEQQADHSLAPAAAAAQVLGEVLRCALRASQARP